MTDRSLRPNPAGDWPTVDPSAWVDPSAVLIGNVRVGPRTFVGPGTVVGADKPDQVGAEGYDRGAAILTDFIVGELARFRHVELDPLDRPIIQGGMDGGTTEGYERLLPSTH